ncbi:MAG: hypothetical protein ACERLM_14950, partial [Acidimicrobiales bacterium]
VPSRTAGASVIGPSWQVAGPGPTTCTRTLLNNGVLWRRDWGGRGVRGGFGDDRTEQSALKV